jgi:hypothetical protein
VAHERELVDGLEPGALGGRSGGAQVRGDGRGELLERLDGVRGAARVEAAGGGKERRDQPLVEAHEEDERPADHPRPPDPASAPRAARSAFRAPSSPMERADERADFATQIAAGAVDSVRTREFDFRAAFLKLTGTEFN